MPPDPLPTKRKLRAGHFLLLSLAVCLLIGAFALWFFGIVIKK